ncbi:hypothetical protein GCM10023216_14640 [Isoptericola chiayiensis]|uniref:Integral membrane protein n=1 Tax=Isoptericola chiayiensis TaxID=579446 RepID=A0ABP8YC12_9MICO|nr:hypothetical protein [Isoptericola chiayiensis]NOW02095.1 hypothetical protein [Isoptericola chiayiensis]
MTATTPATRGGTARALLIGWICALVGFLVGEYGAGLVLVGLRSSSGDQAMIDWSWLPWIAAAVLCGLAVGLWTPVGAETPWWRWLAVGAPVPVGSGLVTWAYFASYGVAIPDQWLSTLVQVLIAVALALAVGLMRTRRAGRGEAP